MSDSNPVSIVHGIPEGARPAVARLYWEAFGRKLAPSLNDRDRGEKYLESQLSANGFLCATVAGDVVGVLGYHDHGRAAVGLSLGELGRVYSRASAPWRAALLLILGRTPAADELLLDGLSVAPEARGLGIGTHLLEKAIALAEERGLREVRLSVVDSNPRARALYGRLGFIERGTVSIGLLGRLFGFRRATDMVFRIPERAAE